MLSAGLAVRERGGWFRYAPIVGGGLAAPVIIDALFCLHLGKKNEEKLRQLHQRGELEPLLRSLHQKAIDGDRHELEMIGREFHITIPAKNGENRLSAE